MKRRLRLPLVLAALILAVLILTALTRAMNAQPPGPTSPQPTKAKTEGNTKEELDINSLITVLSALIAAVAATTTIIGYMQSRDEKMFKTRLKAALTEPEIQGIIKPEDQFKEQLKAALIEQESHFKDQLKTSLTEQESHFKDQLKTSLTEPEIQRIIQPEGQFNLQLRAALTEPEIQRIILPEGDFVTQKHLESWSLLQSAKLFGILENIPKK